MSIGSPNCRSLAGLEPGVFRLGRRHRTKRGCNGRGDHLRPKSGSLSACSRRARPRWRALGDAYAKARRLPIAAIACDGLGSLKRLDEDEALLVQSGKPVSVFRTHADAPRVLIANSNLVPHWVTWAHFNELDHKGLAMYRVALPAATG